MHTWKKALSSSLGKKWIMALTGLGLVGFTITHLLGNLALLEPTGVAFNRYAKGLEDLGSLLWVAEIGLVALFLTHIVMAFALKRDHWNARPTPYSTWKSKGGESRANYSSLTMIITGVVLFGFLILHIRQFKFGPGIPHGYLMSQDGSDMRDLHRLVRETFQRPLYVSIYCIVMLILGFHLRHGFWSAFQSLGLTYPRYTKIIYGAGLAIAALLALGFFALPLVLYLRG